MYSGIACISKVEGTCYRELDHGWRLYIIVIDIIHVVFLLLVNSLKDILLFQDLLLLIYKINKLHLFIMTYGILWIQNLVKNFHYNKKTNILKNIFVLVVLNMKLFNWIIKIKFVVHHTLKLMTFKDMQ